MAGIRRLGLYSPGLPPNIPNLPQPQLPHTPSPTNPVTTGPATQPGNPSSQAKPPIGPNQTPPTSGVTHLPLDKSEYLKHTSFAPNFKLSKHFNLNSPQILTCSISQASTNMRLPVGEIVYNLAVLMTNVGDRLLEKYGTTMIITNALRLGSYQSFHHVGAAFDFYFNPYVPARLQPERCKEIASLIPSFDELLLETKCQWGNGGVLYHVGYLAPGTKYSSGVFSGKHFAASMDYTNGLRYLSKSGWIDMSQHVGCIK